MLPKAVGEIAKTFLKDGMKLDDAVLAAFRLMDEPIPAAVPKILAKDNKFVGRATSEVFDNHPGGSSFINESVINPGIWDIPSSPAQWSSRLQDDRRAMLFPSEPDILSMAQIARQHALRQLGLLD